MCYKYEVLNALLCIPLILSELIFVVFHLILFIAVRILEEAWDVKYTKGAELTGGLADDTWEQSAVIT